MAYTLDFALALGAGNTGLTLEAQIVDTAGANVGAAITTGFVEFGGSGNYLWHTAAIPDSHRGGVRFQVSPGGAVKAFAAVNPQEAEFTDVKTSTRSSHTAADVWAASGRTLSNFGTLVADVAAAVWNTLTSTLTTVGSIGKLIVDNAGSSLTAAGVWSYITRTLTQSAASVISALTGPNFSVLRGESISFSLTNIGSLVGNNKLWFTVKYSDSELDIAAIFQLEKTGGLLRLAGATATSTDGTLTVDDATLGNITMTLKPSASSLLPKVSRAFYDVQMLVGATITTKAQGEFTITGDITRAIS